MAKRAKIFVTILCVNKPPLYVTMPPWATYRAGFGCHEVATRQTGSALLTNFNNPVIIRK